MLVKMLLCWRNDGDVSYVLQFPDWVSVARIQVAEPSGQVEILYKERFTIEQEILALRHFDQQRDTNQPVTLLYLEAERINPALMNGKNKNEM